MKREIKLREVIAIGYASNFEKETFWAQRMRDLYFPTSILPWEWRDGSELNFFDSEWTRDILNVH